MRKELTTKTPLHVLAARSYETLRQAGLAGRYTADYEAQELEKCFRLVELGLTHDTHGLFDAHEREDIGELLAMVDPRTLDWNGSKPDVFAFDGLGTYLSRYFEEKSHHLTDIGRTA